MATRNIPEIWGGIECSFTRVNDLYGDQLDYCGHYRRGVQDIEDIAQIGFKAIRYPIIWERYNDLKDYTSWAWLARQLNALRYYNIKPIAGLVHHGSGPIHACVSDPCFSVEIEKYAFHVAQRFPWLEYYTPINEPLTTARFCGLYGFWHPHKTDALSFAQIFLNEMKAVVLSMKAVRKINPRAKLIQTEDLSKIYSTPLLKYQAEFENERRWLTYDLLCGQVKQGHAMWDYLVWLGIQKEALEFFINNPCRPDILGTDYYATSERFLDEDLKKYPPHVHGSNGQHQYADVEAIRIKLNAAHGPKILLKECWDRYSIPIVITEVHIHGSPEDQIRWFYYLWRSALELKNAGVGIQAVTAWAMFGSYGWSKLLTEYPGEYERGVFDLTCGDPEHTAYTDFLKALSLNPYFKHPALYEQSWWEMEDRFLLETSNEIDEDDRNSVD
jgi:dTDP-4-dehydrorhamnose reductase